MPEAKYLYEKLPPQMEELLKEGNMEELRRLFSQCQPNAVNWCKLNIFSLMPMPREFALWAKEQGADINFRNYRGRTPLFEIARRDGDVSLLVELGADVNAAAKDGYTPLHVAAGRGCKKAVRALLRAGAKIDARTRDYDGFGHYTPMELAIYKSDLSSIRKYEICKLLLSQGAERTERSRRFVSAFSEAFYRHIAGKASSKALQSQEESLKKLCELFDVKMCAAPSFHDGVSPILVTSVGGSNNIFKELWDFLVPSSGRAKTAQGEVIRIAGRIGHELMDNGGMNWDEDYRNMLYTFQRYFCPDPGEEPDEYVEEIIEALKDGDVNDRMIWRMQMYAISWVENNPEVRPLLEADYTR